MTVGAVVTISSSSEMVLLNSRDMDNLMTICDMMNLDLITATTQYLESNQNMDEWAQRFVIFFAVC